MSICSATATPPFRRLRIFAFDPSLERDMEAAVVNNATVKVLWDEPLARGPVGEYVEVVDYDPASDACYEPVDLNDPRLLATDGLAPSDGNPQFHQQMVYAVAMTTIRNFERALGRRALWSPRRVLDRDGNAVKGPTGKDLYAYVQRLRIYPHAMREANAYYTPERKALLFGYFRASTANPGNSLPGGMVFTCLSHDVVAHETTHALLDGMHRQFIEASNPDSLAFHEAFADIVALFQHFSFPDVLRLQIARSRGDLAGQNLLGQLAQEVGQAVGNYGALRDAIGHVNRETGKWEQTVPDPAALEDTTEPHARGSILVAAVFDAFLSIYKARIADLLRIATSGSGVLPVGQIHPDLVNRLAREAAKSSQHVLNMCVRALDYCPPVDVTFGEYLRALITADYELVKDDDLNYRAAVIEAFRRRGIFPRDVRTLSVDTLLWRPPKTTQRGKMLDDFVGSLVDNEQENLRTFMRKWDMNADRREVYESTEKLGASLHNWISQNRGTVNDLLPALDIRDPNAVFQVASLRPTRRAGPDGDFVSELVIEIVQRRAEFQSDARQRAGVGRFKNSSGQPYDFYFRGGYTLIINLDTHDIRYAIYKSMQSRTRLERQRRYDAERSGLSLSETYFDGSEGRPREPFAMLHRQV